MTVVACLLAGLAAQCAFGVLLGKFLARLGRRDGIDELELWANQR